MEDSLNNTSKRIFGYWNPSFTGTINYSHIKISQDNMVSSSIDEATFTGSSSPYTDCTFSVKGSVLSKRNLRSSSDPSRNNITPLMDSLSLDDSKNKIPSWETVSNTSKDHSPTKEKIHTVFSGAKVVGKHRETNPEKDLQKTTLSWPLSYVKLSKGNFSQNNLPPSLKFSSRGFPTQNGNFTPIMYRRAISLRGHSRRNHVDLTKGNKTGNGSLKLKGGAILRRSNSEKASTNITSNVEDSSGKVFRSSPSTNSFRRYGSYQEGSPSVRRRSEENGNVLLEDSFSARSDDSHDSFDITKLVKQNVCDTKFYFHSSEALTNDLRIFNKNLEEYILSLSELLMTYDKMKVVSPDKIRQHFDLPLKLIKSVFKLQCEINKTVKDADRDLIAIAKIFLSDQFIVYQQYMIISPTIYADFRQYKDHLEINFPVFKNLILLPTSRLNFYAQTLNNLYKFASSSEKRELEKAINYLEDLKRNANTEMTIKIVKDSPVDLHLGGKILHVGELNYVSGPLPKRSYYLIAFENMLVITISKVSFCTYVTHYRPEQIVSVGGEKNLELTVATSSCVQGFPEVHHFKNCSNKVLEKWFLLVEEWILDTMASYEIAKNSDKNLSTYIKGKNFPLSLWQVFPFLKRLCFNENGCSALPAGMSTRELCSLLVEREKEYVEKLNSIFNPETLPPPPELKDLLQRILNLHELYFLPELEDALKKKSHFVVNVFMNYLENFTTYKTYLIKRSLSTTHMPDGIRAQYYVVPVQHFAFYVEWSKELGMNENFRGASAYAVDALLTYITDAKVMLLHEAIPDCCLDFYRTGELKRGSYMDLRVRPRQKGLRDGSYVILLFEKVLLILKTVSPTYNLVFDIWLYQVNFGPPSESSNGFKLEYRQGGNKSPITFEFKTQSTISKQEWVQHLTKELQSQAEQIKRCSVLQNIS